MKKEITINLEIDFPEYKDLKAAIKECKRKWDTRDFTYENEVVYKHTLVLFPGGYFRIYASDDTHFQPTFDEMHEGYLFADKKFELSKEGYNQLVDYAMSKINGMCRVL